MRTDGARLLAATGLDHAAIAAEIGVGRTSVTQWLLGDKKPGVGKRAAICAAYGVPVDAWDRPAGSPGAAATGLGGGPVGSSASSPGTATGAGTVDARGRLEQQLARLDRIRAEGEAPGGDLPPQARLRLEATETRCIELLGRMAGDASEISEAKIVRTPAWRRLSERVRAALEPYPDAAMAVARAVEEIE